MTSITLNVTGARIRAAVNGPLTSGMVGIPVTIRYDDSWNGLTKNLVCRCGKWGPDKGDTRTVLNIGKTATVAHEVMQADMHLYLGIEGYSANGKLVIPTTWADCGKIQHGANAGTDPSTNPKLPVWAQMQAEIKQIKQNSVTEGEITAAVAAYLKENPIESSAVKSVNGTAPDADGNVEIIISDSSQNANCLLTVETITIGEAGDIPVTGITLDYNSISLNAGDSMMLAASIFPSNATNKTVLWKSSNTSIATVSNGYVTAVAEGDAVITAYSVESNSIKATCAVAVAAAESGGEEEPEVTLTSISATCSGGDVAVGTAVTDLTGIVVTAHYSDGTSEPVSGYTLSCTIAEGSNTITVSYGGKTATFTVNGVAESDGTVTVLYRNLDIVQGSLAKVDGTIAAISNGMYVEFLYYEDIMVSTLSNSNWYMNYPPIAVYTNGVYNSVDYTEGGLVSGAKHYTATLTGYPAGSVVRVNIFTGALAIEAADEYLYYSYES